MMRKTFRFTALLIPVLILVLYLLKERSPFGGRNTTFAVSPKNEITGIKFSYGSHKLDLERKDDEWILNRQYETRRSSILFILKILTEMEIKSPVTQEMFNNEIDERGIEPVRVKVYEKGRIIRSFLVYKTPSNAYGNIMKLREGSKPYIVFVPGNEVDIGSAFAMNELFWQPYTIFNLLPSEISSVTFENSTDPDASFRIEHSDLNFRLFNPSEEMDGWDTSRLIRYLSYFTHVPFESWAFELAAGERETIENIKPLYKITVEQSGGEKTALLLWERSIEENSIKKIDTDRLWGQIANSNDLFIVRYVDIDPLLKKVSYFFPQ